MSPLFCSGLLHWASPQMLSSPEPFWPKTWEDLLKVWSHGENEWLHSSASNLKWKFRRSSKHFGGSHDGEVLEGEPTSISVLILISLLLSYLFPFLPTPKFPSTSLHTLVLFVLLSSPLLPWAGGFILKTYLSLSGRSFAFIFKNIAFCFLLPM